MSDRYDLMTGAAVTAGGKILAALLPGAPVDISCVRHAVAVSSAALLAQRIGVTEGGSSGRDYMSAMERGLQMLMQRAIAGAILGEQPLAALAPGSTYTAARQTVTSLLSRQHYAASPVSATVGGTPGVFSVPPGLLFEVFGGRSEASVDVHVSSHAWAPGQASGQNIVSPLVTMSLMSPDTGKELAVHNLAQPVVITIPVDTTRLSDLGRMLFKQQARCVFWSNGAYSSDGCRVTSVTLASVNCSCDHLTAFAVNQDVSIPACGDGVIQKGEVCDDKNLVVGDGCSRSCQLEGDYS